jgi:hypothetical protein
MRPIYSVHELKRKKSSPCRIHGDRSPIPVFPMYPPNELSLSWWRTKPRIRDSTETVQILANFVHFDQVQNGFYASNLEISRIESEIEPNFSQNSSISVGTKFFSQMKNPRTLNQTCPKFDQLIYVGHPSATINPTIHIDETWITHY